MTYEPGRLLLVAYPFTDQSAAKIRPVLVVSGSEFNQGEDFVVVPLSSRPTTETAFSFKISATDPYFPQTQLRGTSIVKWTKPMTISAKVVEKKLGIVPPEALKQIQAAIRTLFV